MEMERTYRMLFALGLLGVSTLLLGLALGWTTPLDYIDSLLRVDNQRWVMGVLGILGLIVAVFIFRGAFAKKPITQTEVVDTTLGKVKITLNALENMTGKVAKQIPGVRETKAIIKSTPSGIAIFVQASLAPDINIPEVTVSIQNKIQNYFKNTVGIEVEEVRVLVTKLSSEGKSRVE